MDLSIIIVNYNTGKLVKTCIDKILNNTKNLTFPSSEIIVVENASPDEPVEDLPKNVILIKNDENLGYAKANNQGLKIAKGRHVLLLNSDTEIKKGAFKDLTDFADSNPNTGVIGAKLILPTRVIQKSVFHFPTIWRAFQEYILKLENKFSLYAPDVLQPVEVEAVVGAVFLITDKAKEKVGFLDERYFMYFEDLDYCKRVKAAGLKVYYHPAVEFLHHHGASGKNLADSENQWRRLIPASKTYHGLPKHHLINWIIRIGQKLP